MHRVQAGDPDASGWTTAASTHGGFSVRLPMKFNDFTMESPAGSKIAKHFIVGGKNAKGLKFLAMRILYREKGAQNHFFARIESGKALPKATVKKHLFQGRKAADVSMRSPSAFAYFRYVLVADSMVMLSLEVPRGPLTLPPMAMVRKFFASLQISTPPKSQAAMPSGR